MTSITFPFFVGMPKPDKSIALEDAEFRFTTKAARALEGAAGCGITFLLAKGQTVELTVLLVCYGLQWQPQLKMTEAKAVDLIDEFIDAGGNVTALSEALYKALDSSGVYGKVDDKKGGGERPLTTPSAAAPA